jgi:hypothetical protein
MFLLVHATVGAVLAELLPVPAAAAAGFASHFVVDAVPHGDEWIGRELARPGRLHWLVALALLDGLAALSFVTILWVSGLFQNSAGAFSGALGAMLPDALVGASELSNGRLWSGFARRHTQSHQLLGYELSLPVGAAVQLLTMLGILAAAV